MGCDLPEVSMYVCVWTLTASLSRWIIVTDASRLFIFIRGVNDDFIIIHMSFPEDLHETYRGRHSPFFPALYIKQGCEDMYREPCCENRELEKENSIIASLMEDVKAKHRYFLQHKCVVYKLFSEFGNIQKKKTFLIMKQSKSEFPHRANSNSFTFHIEFGK